LKNELHLTDADSLPETERLSLTGRLFSGFFSYMFHPLFVPVYVVYILLYIHPSAFTGFSDENRFRTLVIVILNLVFFPLISVLLLRAVGFVESIYLKTQKDRIIPYIASGIFFFWTYTVFKQQSVYPLLLVSFVFAVFLASSAALIANIYLKVSMHAIGMGGWLGFFLVLMFTNSMLMSFPIAVVLLLTGLVCTSRLMNKSHIPFEIYLGLLIGILTQYVAYKVVF
jgi:hypothetical protein